MSFCPGTICGSACAAQTQQCSEVSGALRTANALGGARRGHGVVGSVAGLDGGQVRLEALEPCVEDGVVRLVGDEEPPAAPHTHKAAA